MADRAVARYRKAYAGLLRLYPKPYRERFAEPMEQTFADLCRERSRSGRPVAGLALAMVADTALGVLRENLHAMTRHGNIARIAIVVALILLVPLTAMQFTDEVRWTLFDFVFAGALLFGVGLAYELFARNARDLAYRAATAIALAAVLLLTWINAAVGIIGSETNPANRLYGAVLVVGVVGAAVAHCEARGMARTLSAMAAVQMLVPVVALPFWTSAFSEPPGPAGVFALNALFATLLAASALLFRRAARARS